MYVLGLFLEGPNTGACLFQDGVLVAMVEEERFTRSKRASETFPSNSIRFCLKQAKIRLAQVKTVALGWDHSKYPAQMDAHMRSIAGRASDPFADEVEKISHLKLSAELTRFNVQTSLRQIDREANPEIVWYPHHLCHAASVHFLSGFEDSAVLVMDGSGEEFATTTWTAQGKNIESVESWKLPHSLGWFYASVTEWLGFKAYSGEGKVMGVAAYGRPDATIREKLRQFCYVDAENVYKVDPTFVYYGPRSYSRKYTDKLVGLLGTPRTAESELSEYHINVAYELQSILEETATSLLEQLFKKTKSRNLCISGGVAMNCKMNGVLSNFPGVENVFINPASHDSGTALGAALLACRDLGISPNKNTLTHAYWGPESTPEEIEKALDHCGLSYKRCDNISAEVAKLLSQDQIVGWFQGRAEFGARALGGRSILGNPMNPKMKEIINARVKYREAFRPFAPSMLDEVRDRYMVNPKRSPFMILAYPFKEEFKKLFPSIVHVDGSVRPQTVEQKTNPLYFEMIREFGSRMGHSIVLNTSFNIRGEPIVNSPLEAVRCFYSTAMDNLAIGPYLLSKK